MNDQHQYPAINPNARQFMIGYGTLMQQQSRQRTHPEIVDVYPVMVEGVQRVWGLADTTYGMTYLTAIDDPTASFNAVYYQCTPEDIRQCDQREYSYYREKIDQSRLHALGLSTLMEGDYWMYVMPASTITLPTADTPLVQSYIDVVLDGVFKSSRSFTSMILPVSFMPPRAVGLIVEKSKHIGSMIGFTRAALQQHPVA